jgi:hypothetical protein
MRTDHVEMPASGAGVNTNGGNGGKPVRTGQFLAKSANYAEGHRAWDAVEWKRRKLDVEPTWKMAAAVFGVSMSSLTKARRLLDGHGQHAGHHNGGQRAKETCPICSKKFSGFGHSPWPVTETGRACDQCNETRVTPARLARWRDYMRSKLKVRRLATEPTAIAAE